MASTENLDNLEWVLAALKAAQEADADNRERAKEAKLFIHQRGGQWEQEWYDQNKGKPRYSFDLTEPVVDQISDAMKRAEFDIRVTPAGSGANKEYAKTYDGLLRDIHMASSANSIFNRAGRSMVECGLDGWRVVQEYADGDSFDQELRIKKIPNYLERVWFGPHEEPDASDAEYCWILAGLTPEEFKAQFPKKNAQSVDQNRVSSAYYHRNELIMVGELLCLEPVEIELVKMSDERVFRVDTDFLAMRDELEAAGITEVDRRKTKKHVVYSRLFSAGDWLTEPRKTVFEAWLPVIPCYANFEVIEDKIIYRGAVEKLMDPQRVFNYSMSREIEEGALAPRAKYWMTETQAAGYEDKLGTLNTNSDPVQIYNPDPLAPGPPQQNGGAQVNPGLRTISEATKQVIDISAGMYAASRGDNPNNQSGVAIGLLQDRSDVGSDKYTEARELSQTHTTKILMKAIPRVYSQGRQIRLLREDGSHEVATIGERVQDSQTGQLKTLNDLSIGTYDVDVSSGPSFKSRQNDTVDAIVKVGQVDPSVVEMGGDVLLGNIPSPGMDDLAARKRRQLFQAGVIPPDQMTEQEKAEMQAAQNQPPQESPDMVLARAEEVKGQAELTREQIRMQELQSKAQHDQRKLAIEEFEAATKRMEAETDRMAAMASAQKAGADAAKSGSQATGQDIDNSLKVRDAARQQLVDALTQALQPLP